MARRPARHSRVAGHLGTGVSLALAFLVAACSQDPAGIGVPLSEASIAFVSNGPDSFRHIYVLNLGDSSMTQLTHSTASDDAPAWSPDRRRIAFQRNGDATAAGVWLMGADGSGAVRATSLVGIPAWLPGGRMAVMARESVTVINLNRSPYSTSQAYHLGTADVAWSPDGWTIAFTGIARDFEDARFTLVYLWNVNRSIVRPLRAECTSYACGYSDSERGPAWSPDGKKLAFWSRWFGITVANRDGSGMLSVTHDGWGVTGGGSPDPSEAMPDWSPEGDRLVFVREGQLFVTRADGTGAARAVTALPSGAWSPAWSR